MTTKEINLLLTLRDKTVQSIAVSIGESKDRVSATINYLRKNQRVREKIAEHLGMTVDELFGDEGKGSASAAAYNCRVNNWRDTSTGRDR